MRRLILFSLITLSAGVVLIISCKRSSSVAAPDAVTAAIKKSNFPASVGSIFINKCATAGCHDVASAANADGLLMDTWEHLFNGANDGASVVPYSTSFSQMLYYINTNTANGPIALPTMPITTTTNNLAPLTQAEYDTISNWIARGAPDVNGNIAFSANPGTRQKIYVTQSGSNQIAVIDAKTKMVMRYIAVGESTLDQAQHDITISSDGRYAYITFYIGNIVQKIDCMVDTVVATADLSTAYRNNGAASWSIATLSPDNSTLLVSGFQPYGCVIAINTATMQIDNNLSIGVYDGLSPQLAYPHGIGNNATFDTFCACLEYGNVITKWWFKGGSPYFKTVTLNHNIPSTTSVPGITPDPHQIEMSPDYSKYFVSCEGSGEIRVMDARTDVLLDSIRVGTFPQEMAISESRNLLFVACMEDSLNPNAQSVGSVYVIDINTHHVVKVIYGNFYQPHDMSVDEQDGLLFVNSTNVNPGGPPLHHVVLGGGRPGWYSVYDLNTLQPADGNIYVQLVNPYAMANRF